MKTNLLLAAVVFAALITSTALAQGTATGPSTEHDIDVGPIVLIGDPNNPMSIDADPNGRRPLIQILVERNLFHCLTLNFTGCTALLGEHPVNCP